jgi:predicted transcriptional regulator
MPLPENVRARRRKLKLTQPALAAQIGVSRAAIAQIEAGKIWPAKATLYRLAEALRTTPGRLID